MCTAELKGGDDLAAGALQQPLGVQFGCEGVTISGIELEVQCSGANRIADLLRRFTTGVYRVSLPAPAAGAPIE